MRKAFVFLGLFSFLAGCSLAPVQPLSGQNQNLNSSELIWKQVEAGLSYAQIAFTLPDLKDVEAPKNLQDLQLKQRNLLMVRVDPKKFRFHIYQNKDRKTAKSIQDIYLEKQAVLAFNGAFYGEDFTPIGYLKSDGKEIYQISKAALMDGIFAILQDDVNGSHGVLFDAAKFVRSSLVTFAVQNGPVLIDDQGGIKITADNGKLASRTAIGLDKDGNIVVILLQQSFFNTDNVLTLYQFAHLMKENSLLQNLGLHGVLNLDGGPSSGLMVDGHYYAEMNNVQNVIIVTR